uniref:Uncharacterized protein n=1 Tax=Moniliophthora roreri TaxID=221103 RepID=A0A0W0EYH7_MONRR
MCILCQSVDARKGNAV